MKGHHASYKVIEQILQLCQFWQKIIFSFSPFIFYSIIIYICVDLDRIQNAIEKKLKRHIKVEKLRFLA